MGLFEFGKLLHFLRLRRELDSTTKNGRTTCDFVLASRLPKNEFHIRVQFCGGGGGGCFGPGLIAIVILFDFTTPSFGLLDTRLDT